MRPDPTKARADLLKKYRYDAEAGRLYHKTGPRAGDEAGTYRMGYLYILFMDKQYALGRLIWLIETGRWPAGNIRYENKDSLDNTFANLRDTVPPRRWKAGDEVHEAFINSEFRRLGLDPDAGEWGVRPPVCKFLLL